MVIKNMIDNGGTGIVCVEKSGNTCANARNTTPFSVIKMDLIKVVSKQTLLALIDFIVFVAYTITAAIFQGETVIGVILLDTLATLQYGYHLNLPMKNINVYLLNVIIACLKCAKCAIEKVKKKNNK